MYELRPYQKEQEAEIKRHMREGKRHILVQSPPGSGKSVLMAEIIRKATEKGNKVLFLVHRRELITNIKDTLRENDVNFNYMYFFSPAVALRKAKNGELPEPDIIITDETHHSPARTYTDLYTFFDSAYRIGFTATPWRLNGRGFEDIYEVMVEGKSVSWLIENNYLAPYKWYSVPLLDRSDIDFSSQKKTASTTEEALDSVVIRGDIVAHYQKYANGEQAIVYAPTISASKLIAEAFEKAGIKAVHADAKTPTKERDGIMADFQSGKIKILCNVDLVSEGFNVPDCSCVILCRPTQSLVLHLQQSMRCMRYKEGKTAIILDHVGNGLTLGVPDLDYKWTIKSRQKKKKKRKEVICDEEMVVCSVCSSVFVKDKDLTECTNCGEPLKPEKEEKSVTVDDSVELVELSKDDVIMSLKFSKNQNIEFNFQIAKEKAKRNGGNPLYKVMRYYVIKEKKVFSEEELSELAGSLKQSLKAVKRAYNWALEIKEKEKEKINNKFRVFY